VSISFISLLCICLVEMIESCLVMVVIVVMILGVMLKLSWVVNWVVCSICSGLLLNEDLGVLGVWISFVVRFCNLLCGLMNFCCGSDSVIVLIVKLWCMRLFLRFLL